MIRSGEVRRRPVRGFSKTKTGALVRTAANVEVAKRVPSNPDAVVVHAVPPTRRTGTEAARGPVPRNRRR